MPRKVGPRIGRNTASARWAKIERLKESPVKTEFRKRENAIKRQAKREAAKRVGESNFQSREQLEAQEECQATLRASQSFFRSQRHLNRQAKQQASSTTRQVPEQLQAKRTPFTHMIASINNDVLQNPRSLSWSTLSKLFLRVKCPKSYHICSIRTHLVYRIGGCINDRRSITKNTII